MTRAERRRLLEPAVQGPGTWADLGAGSGAFTEVLAELLGPEGTVYAVDRDRRALEHIPRPPHGAHVVTLAADFTGPLELPPLGGILLANSLHYVRDAAVLLRHLRGLLKPEGVVLVVEYADRRPSPWVPYPVPPARLGELAQEAGFEGMRELGRVGSSFGGSVYSALLSMVDGR
ncbi:class I SAM-dependent methyltransferase [Calidithermus chliarophilus]|uniref:class I SAM-dependent methyltransferase n=1 Tax=Calidithermus chliarophilus TaxID=52023 RepID=UPI0004272DC8|nr:methyltransferase [Calidithermus chliarophilus]